MKKPELRPFPGQEPKQDKADLAVFDRCNVTRPIKLFDKELPPTIEEWPEPYTLKRRKHLPRPFLSPAGEVVMRLRGGEGLHADLCALESCWACQGAWDGREGR